MTLVFVASILGQNCDFPKTLSVSFFELGEVPTSIASKFRRAADCFWTFFPHDAKESWTGGAKCAQDGHNKMLQ